MSLIANGLMGRRVRFIAPKKEGGDYFGRIVAVAFNQAGSECSSFDSWRFHVAVELHGGSVTVERLDGLQLVPEPSEA